MIEIKISIDDASQLLLQRMKLELRMRQKAGTISTGLRLDNLSYNELMSIVDSAIFDTVFLLPIDILTSETNLTQIITATVRAMSKVLLIEEFALFTEKHAQCLILPIVGHIKAKTKENKFSEN